MTGMETLANADWIPDVTEDWVVALGMETLASAGWIPVGIVFIVVGLPVICFTLITLIRMFSGGGRSQREATREETRMIQEIHASMEKMEDRIESLEAIVVDRERRKETRL